MSRPLRKLSFIEVHNQFFMQGSNLGNKINAAQKGALLCDDDARNRVWIHYKGKTSFIPHNNVASGDCQEIPEDIQDFFGLNVKQEEIIQGPPAVRRGRKPSSALEENLALASGQLSPEELHRQEVRARSANAFKANAAVTSDYLIQESRNAAMGIKQPQMSAQVQTAQQVGQGAAVTGKPKAISHAQLKAQVAQEMKDTKPV